MPKELEGDWIWSSRTLWSELFDARTSARESWNDGPYSETSMAEIHAWTNENAFVARLTSEGVKDFTTYGG
jgi:hypothetical protein